jgi:hypothetical protein
MEEGKFSVSLLLCRVRGKVNEKKTVTTKCLLQEQHNLQVLNSRPFDAVKIMVTDPSAVPSEA